jgi:hypothetical protein
MLAAVEQWRPDVVVRESAELSSAVAADRFGVPHAQISISLSTQLADRVLRDSVARLDELRAMAGLGPDPQATSARSSVLTMAPATLEGPSAPLLPPVQRFRDPAVDTATFEHDTFGDPDLPLIYLSFGTQVPSPTRSYLPSVYVQGVTVSPPQTHSPSSLRDDERPRTSGTPGSGARGPHVRGRHFAGPLSHIW